jgi:hypothetical protein
MRARAAGEGAGALAVALLTPFYRSTSAFVGLNDLGVQSAQALSIRASVRTFPT